MSDDAALDLVGHDSGDAPPGLEEPGTLAAGVRVYLYGLALAIALTFASFWAAQTHLIYGPAVPVAIAVFAVAQMGVHLVFFLHITTSPDNANNALALAFGVLIAGLVVFGSLWIMNHLNHNLMPLQQLVRL
jgi:cytochrome o ubiquinol oxidase subunit IV